MCIWGAQIEAIVLIVYTFFKNVKITAKKSHFALKRYLLLPKIEKHYEYAQVERGPRKTAMCLFLQHEFIKKTQNHLHISIFSAIVSRSV